MHNSCEERPHHPGPDRAAAGAPEQVGVDGHHDVDRGGEQDVQHGRAPRPHELVPHGGGHRQAGEEVLQPQGDHPHFHTIPLSKVRRFPNCDLNVNLRRIRRDTLMPVARSCAVSKDQEAWSIHCLTIYQVLNYFIYFISKIKPSPIIEV